MILYSQRFVIELPPKLGNRPNSGATNYRKDVCVGTQGCYHAKKETKRRLSYDTSGPTCEIPQKTTVKADVCRREPFRKKPSGPRAFVRFC